MKLSEAKTILGSVGYSVKTDDLDTSITKTVNQLMESLERRNATRTKSYAILSEMARFNGRYTGSFAGLEDAGTVTLKVRGQDKEFSVAEALSKVENDFKSANSKGMKQATAEILLANFDTALAAVPETANQEYITELNKEREYIAQCLEGGDGIPVGGWTEEGLARTTHSRDDSALTPADLISKINNQISSLNRGGRNYDLIKARIDALLERGDELTAEERSKAEDLYVKLDIANSRGTARSVSSGRIAIFRPNEGITQIRIRTRLDNKNVAYTINDEGNYVITRNIDKAKEVLDGMGEWVTPDAPAAAPSNAVAYKFNLSETDLADLLEYTIAPIGVRIEQRGEYYVINGTAAQMRRLNTTLNDYSIDFEAISPDEVPAEEEPAQAGVDEAMRIARKAGYRVIKENTEVESSDNLLDVAARLTDYGSI